MKIKLTELIPNPEQPRSVIDQVELQGLADSIREHGLLNPISVEGPQDNGLYIILDGERRWRAHKLIGLEEIECHIARPALNGSGQVERLVLGLIGNLQRQDMNIIERAQCYKRLRDLGMTNTEIGKIGNMSSSMISTNMNLLDMPLEIQGLYENGSLPFDSRLVRLFCEMDEEAAVRLAKKAAARQMTCKRIIYLANKIGAYKPEPEKARNPEQGAVARANVIFTIRAEFGHWNALAQLRMQLGNGFKPMQKIKEAVIETCQNCALYDDASQNVCRDCPAVELIRRLM